jgi:hypothetical protein
MDDTAKVFGGMVMSSQGLGDSGRKQASAEAHRLFGWPPVPSVLPLTMSRQKGGSPDDPREVGFNCFNMFGLGLGRAMRLLFTPSRRG